MKIHCFRHVPFEGLGNIEDWIESKGHSLSATLFYENPEFPNIEDIDWLIVMGGPMGAYEENIYPWLTLEKEIIAQAIKRGIKVLGICLGAQLIASALGAKVYPADQKEIGWFPLRLTKQGIASKLFQNFPQELDVLHWHGDTFDLPACAIHLAESSACKNQAFSYRDNVLALQFHLDLKKENVEALIKNCGNELVNAPYIQSAEQMMVQDNKFEKIAAYMNKLLTALEHIR
jgi:GMP synthase-like glutamine amidotransferase